MSSRLNDMNYCIVSNEYSKKQVLVSLKGMHSYRSLVQYMLLLSTVYNALQWKSVSVVCSANGKHLLPTFKGPRCRLSTKFMGAISFHFAANNSQVKCIYF